MKRIPTFYGRHHAPQPKSWTRGSIGRRADRGHSLHDRNVRRSLWTLESRAVGMEPFVRLVPDRRGPESRRFQHTRGSLSFRYPLVPLLKEGTLLETSLNEITTGTTRVSPARGAGEMERRSCRRFAGPIQYWGRNQTQNGRELNPPVNLATIPMNTTTRTVPAIAT